MNETRLRGKLLFICLDYNPNFGGIAEYSHNLALDLRREGCPMR